MVIYRYLADVLVFFHALYASFVVGGLLAVLVGYFLHWQWVRNFWFRLVHFLMIAVVVVESLVGIECPLTAWEKELREKVGENVSNATFIGRWIDAVLFGHHVPDWVLTIVYCIFAALVVASFFLVPPRWPKWWESHSSTREDQEETHPNRRDKRGAA